YRSRTLPDISYPTVSPTRSPTGRRMARHNRLRHHNLTGLRHLAMILRAHRAHVRPTDETVGTGGHSAPILPGPTAARGEQVHSGAGALRICASAHRECAARSPYRVTLIRGSAHLRSAECTQRFKLPKVRRG